MKFLIIIITLLFSCTVSSAFFNRKKFNTELKDLNQQIKIHLQQTNNKSKMKDLNSIAKGIEHLLFNSNFSQEIENYLNQKINHSEKNLRTLSWKKVLTFNWNKKMSWIQKSFKLKVRNFRKELGIYFIFKSLRKEELFCFKQAIDNKSNLNDMFNLVFKKIKSVPLRNLLLFHFLHQSKTTLNDTRNPAYFYSLLSDVDDTALNSFKDSRLPHKGKKLYPGYLQVVDAILDLNTQTPLMIKRNCSPGLTFLTGRSRIGGKGLFKKMKRLGVKRPMSALYGSIPHSIAIIVSDRPMMKKKVERGIGYSKIYPEKKFIFLGDNGQLDLEVGQNLSKKIGRKKILTSYINNIKKESHLKNPKGGLLEAGFLRGNQNIKSMDSYAQIIFDLHRLGVLKGKTKIKNYLKNIIKSINNFSSQKEYLKKDGMKDFFLDSIRINCKFLPPQSKDICESLSI